MNEERIIPDPLNYPEDGEKANEYLRLVLSMLSQLQLPPNPVNFTLCYEYVSGHNEELSNILKAILGENKGITKEAAIELYYQYIWDDDKRNFEQQKTEFRRVMTEALSGVEHSADEASKSNEKLGGFTEKLNNLSDFDDIREVVSGVVYETRTMAQNSSQLKQMLTETKQEVENLREELERNRQQATTDALTGLLNRRAFDEEIMNAVEAANESRENLSMLMVDIDHFKKINDTHGHLIGDKVIRFVGSQLAKNVKGKDSVARIGGEEYAVLLPNTMGEHAKSLADSIRTIIEKSRLKRMDTNQPIGTITVSIGTTTYKYGEATDAFMQRADTALYQSKNNGRNKVTLLV